MTGLPEYQQRMSESQHWPAPVQEDLVVPEQPNDPTQASSTAQPSRRPSTSTIVSVSPSYTSPHAYGVTFSGTANFAPLPFPASEHPLPPPTMPPPTLPPTAPILPPPPPPPYTEHHAPEQPAARPVNPRVVPQQQAAAPPFVVYAATPFDMPWSPTMSSPYLFAGHTMMPATTAASFPTAWPPVPLRRIDDYLNGAWTPPTPAMHTSPQYSAAPARMEYPITHARPAPPAAPQPSPASNVLTMPPTVPLVPTSHPLAYASPPSTTVPLPTSHSATAEHAPHGHCAMPGCAAPVFCELSPCSCRLCRDHLGWVIRGARITEDPAASSDKAKSGKKVFRCVACASESSMAHPATNKAKPLAAPPSELVGLGLTGMHPAAPSDDELHSFSIKYFSTGPAPFAHRPASPSSLSGQDIDLGTALDPEGDASLGQHLPPAVEVSPASPIAPFSLSATSQAAFGSSYAPVESASQAPTALLPAVEIEGVNFGGSMLPARPPSPPPAQKTSFASTPAPAPDATFVFPAPPRVEHASPSVLTPVDEKVTLFETSPVSADRPSTANPAMQSTEHTFLQAPERSHSRAATAPPDVPLESPSLKAAECLPAPSPPCSSETPSPAGTPMRRPSLVAPRFGPSQQQQVFGESHWPQQTSPSYRRRDSQPGPRVGGRFSRSYSQPGGLGSSGYGPFPLPSPYSSFPPGSVSVQPQAHAGASTATGLVAFQPMQHHDGIALVPAVAPMSAFYGSPGRSPHGGAGGAGGKKRFSLPSFGGGGGYPRWMDKSSGGVSGSASMPAFPPRMPPSQPGEGHAVERGRWPIVKIPFNTTVGDIERWIPNGYLAPVSECVHAIHLILHRATGRTLPHCYLETLSVERATELIARMDRSQLGDRTVRVKWERAGELLRDLFAQDAYFQQPTTGVVQWSPAAAPLPHLPPEGFRLPEVLLTYEDIGRLVAFSQRPIEFKEKPVERSFYNIVTILGKFPWSREDLVTEELRGWMHEATMQIAAQAWSLAVHDPNFERIAQTIVLAGKNCEGFTVAQKQAIASVNGSYRARSQSIRTNSSRSSPRGSTHSLPPRPPRTPPPGPRNSISHSYLPATPESPESPLLRARPPHMSSPAPITGESGETPGHTSAAAPMRGGGNGGCGSRFGFGRGWHRAMSGSSNGSARRSNEWVNVRGGSGSSDQSGNGGHVEGQRRKNSGGGAPYVLDRSMQALKVGEPEAVLQLSSATAFPPLKPSLDTPPASPEQLLKAAEAGDEAKEVPCAVSENVEAKKASSGGSHGWASGSE